MGAKGACTTHPQNGIKRGHDVAPGCYTIDGGVLLDKGGTGITGSDGLTPITIILPHIAGVMCTEESSHVHRQTRLDGLSLLDELAVKSAGRVTRGHVSFKVFRNHYTMRDTADNALR